MVAHAHTKILQQTNMDVMRLLGSRMRLLFGVRSSISGISDPITFDIYSGMGVPVFLPGGKPGVADFHSSIPESRHRRRREWRRHLYEVV